MKYCEKCGGKLDKFEHSCSSCGYKIPINPPSTSTFLSKSYKYLVVIFILVISTLLYNGFYEYEITSSKSQVVIDQEMISKMIATKLKSIKQPITKVKQSSVLSYYPCVWSNGYLSVNLISERAISGNIEVQGIVNQVITNNYPSMEIFIDIYKGNHKIGTAFTNIDSLPSGMYWKFTAIGTHLNATNSSDYTYEVDTISYY
jgi:hypothetical protein